MILTIQDGTSLTRNDSHIMFHELGNRWKLVFLQSESTGSKTWFNTTA